MKLFCSSTAFQPRADLVRYAVGTIMVDTAKMFAQSARMIADITKIPVPLASGMEPWFDYCEQVAPEQKSLWNRLRRLDFAMDAKSLTKWLEHLLKNEPPPDNINGLWFGLYNPQLDDGEPSCQMYVGCSSGFDPGSDSNEWVCQQSWAPKGRYSSSQVLTELYRSVEPITKDQVSYLGEPFLCHGYLALVVSDWCHGAMRTTLLGNAAIRAVAIGHDSGDFYRMAVLRAGSAA
jgi:hypothetical protein